MKKRRFPKIINHHPQNRKENVSLKPKISIEFNKDLNPDSVNRKTVILKDSYDNRVEGVVGYNNKTAFFEPNKILDPNKEYVVEIRGGLSDPETNDLVSDTLNNPLPQDYEFTFITSELKELKSPTILKPTHQTIIDDIKIEWNKIDTADNYSLEICDDKLFNNIVYSTNTVDTSIKPYGLDCSKEYFVRVKANNVKQSSDWSKVHAFYYEEKETNLTSTTEKEKEVEIEVFDLREYENKVDADQIEFKINKEIKRKDLDKFDVSLIGESIKGIPYIEEHGKVDGRLDIKEKGENYTILRYVI